MSSLFKKEYGKTCLQGRRYLPIIPSPFSVCVRPLRILSSQVMATDQAHFEKDRSSLFAVSLK